MNMQKEMEENLWQKALETLKDGTAPISYDTWVKPLTLLSIDYENDFIYFLVPNQMGKELAEGRYRTLIEQAIEDTFGHSLTLVGVLDPDEIPSSKKIQKYAKKASPYSDDNNLNPKYTFDSFVAGDSNSVANALALAVADNPGKSYNPLFIYGGSGLGKTHLMHAIGHKMLEDDPQAKVLYVSSETFLNEFINSLRDKTQVSFRTKYRNIDILMVDDIQFLENKEKAQEEFFHTFNTLYENSKQIVITSDKPPNETKTLEERLRTRFNWGLSADIQPPDYETRVAILKKKAEQIVNVGPELEIVLKNIAERMQSNVRELEGALNRLIVLATMTDNADAANNNKNVHLDHHKKDINLDLAKNVLRDIFDSKNKEVSTDLIKQIVCKHFNIKISDIESTSRTQNLVVPRQIAMYLCKELIGNISFPKIAEEFRKKDHSTVIHAYKKVDSEMKSDSNFKETVNNLINQINNY